MSALFEAGPQGARGETFNFAFSYSKFQPTIVGIVGFSAAFALGSGLCLLLGINNVTQASSGIFWERSLNVFLKLAVTFALAASIDVCAAPIDTLRSQEPQLFALYEEYHSYASGLEKYANQQGFRSPYENLATVVHEEIHIAQASHQGFYIDGIYYEPYLAAEYWPSVRNRDVIKYVLLGERSLITQVYMPSTGDNGLGSILEEMNAYTHVLPFVCKNERTSASKQVTNLRGFLLVLEVYLRTVRTNSPREYQALLENRFSAGAIQTLTERAWHSLAVCGYTEADFKFPESSAFINSRKIGRPGRQVLNH
jgi:hypothetical protein